MGAKAGAKTYNMPYLTKDDITTHLYPEVRDEITRGNDALITNAINSGTSMAKSYLNRYDILAMFGDANTAPTYQDDMLDNLVKDIVCWQLIRLANPNINLELFRSSYEDAIKFFERVQQGKVDPVWPLRPDDPNTLPDEAGLVQYISNTKRGNYY